MQRNDASTQTTTSSEHPYTEILTKARAKTAELKGVQDDGCGSGGDLNIRFSDYLFKAYRGLLVILLLVVSQMGGTASLT